MRVALDSSALMMPVELDVRLFEELDRVCDGVDPIVPEAVVEELRTLADEGGMEGTAASVGYDLAVDRCGRVDTADSYADDALVELAVDGRVDAVVTNDQPLQERVLDAGVPVIALRGTNKLDITRP